MSELISIWNRPNPRNPDAPLRFTVGDCFRWSGGRATMNGRELSDEEARGILGDAIVDHAARSTVGCGDARAFVVVATNKVSGVITLDGKWE